MCEHLSRDLECDWPSVPVVSIEVTVASYVRLFFTLH